MSLAVRPCLTALKRDLFLPSSVCGPVDLSELRRLAAFCLSDAIAVPFQG